MSIDICTKCDAPVDTEFDLDCYENRECVCESCRENGSGYMKRVDVDNWVWTPYETRY